MPLLKEVSGIHDLESGYYTLANVGNQHNQDREAMRDGRSFTGIAGISNEDTAMQEAQGPIADRTVERLIPSDLAIIRARQGLLKRVRDLENGILPTGQSEDIPYRFAQSASWTFPKEHSWQDAYTALEGVEG